MTERKSLAEYLSVQYPFSAIAEPEGGYVIVYPDLPGCATQVDSVDEVDAVAEEIRTLRIETAYAEGLEIPSPSYPESTAGRSMGRCRSRCNGGWRGGEGRGGEPEPGTW